MHTDREALAEMADRIGNLFDRFVETKLNDSYRFGDVDFYADAETRGGNQVFLNPYVKTEHDLAMKFGAFLEHSFAAAGELLSVHAEIGLYGDSGRQRADLSVHRLSGQLWMDRMDIIESAVAVIEIKGFGVRNPKKYCKPARMKDDLAKFDRLGTPNGAARVLIILDESVAGGRRPDGLEAEYQEIVAAARDQRVTLLSNNRMLDSRHAPMRSEDSLP
jgi:hypothetical protein